MKHISKQTQVHVADIDIADIDIDNITNDSSNWTKLTKEKLKEREHKLMSARTECIQRIINTQCQLFENINTYTLQLTDNPQTKVAVTVSGYKQIMSENNKIIEECLMKLCLELEVWNGVNLNKTKRQMHSFKQYFNTAKNWFDIKKKNILTPEFWIKLFIQWQNFTNVSAHKYFKNHSCANHNNLQTLYAKTLLFSIISKILSGEIFEGNNKPKTLISTATFKNSKPMKQYLSNLHPSLNIDEMIQSDQIPSKRKRINETEVKDFIRKQLHVLTNQTQHQFQECFQRAFVAQKSVHSSTVMPAPVHKITNTNSKRTNISIRPPMWMENMTNSIMSTNNNHCTCSNSNLNGNVLNNGYNGYHRVIVPTYRSFQRYSPMNVSSQNNTGLVNLGNFNVMHNANTNNDVLLQLLSVYLSLM